MISLMNMLKKMGEQIRDKISNDMEIELNELIRCQINIMIRL
jgi:hypothetical protein